MKKIFILLAVIPLFLFFVACDKETEEKTDEVILSEALEKLTFPDTIDSDQTMPTNLDGKIQLEWESSDPTVFTADGKVYRHEEEKLITVTAKATLNDAKKEKAFQTAVLALDTKKIDDIVADTTISADEQLYIFTTVYIKVDNGYYVVNEAKSNLYFVESSDMTSIEVGKKILINVNKKTEENIVCFTELSRKIYSEIDEVTKENYGEEESLSNVTLLAPELANYGKLFTTLGKVQKEGNVFSIVDLGTDEYKFILSDKNTSEVKAKLENAIGEFKISFAAILTNYNTEAEAWEILIPSEDFVVKSEISKLDNLRIVMDYAARQIPNTIDREINRISLPTTHPIITDATIEWKLNDTDGYIAADGTVSRPLYSKNAKIIYRVLYDNYDQSGSVYTTIKSMTFDIDELLSDKYYNEAKCDEGDIAGDTCWNEDTGVYNFSEKLSVRGIIVDITKSYELILKDVKEDVYIQISGLDSNTWKKIHDDIGVGKTVYFEKAGLRTNGFALELNASSATFVESATENTNAIGEYNYTDITFAEFNELDFKKLETYRKIYKIKKAFIYNRDGYTIVGEDSSISGNMAEENTKFTLGKPGSGTTLRTWKGLGEISYTESDNDYYVPEALTFVYADIPVFIRGNRNIISKTEYFPVLSTGEFGAKQTSRITYNKTILYSLGYAEKSDLVTKDEEKKLLEYFVKKVVDRNLEKTLSPSDNYMVSKYSYTESQNRVTTYFPNAILNDEYSSGYVTWQFLQHNVDIKISLNTGETLPTLTCDKEKFCVSEAYDERIHETDNRLDYKVLTPGQAYIQQSTQTNLFILTYQKDSHKKYIADPLNNYPDNIGDRSGKGDYSNNDNVNLNSTISGETFTFTLELKYEYFIDGQSTGEFIEHTVTKTLDPLQDGEGLNGAFVSIK